MRGKKDGVWYDDISQAPDLGSIKCVNETGPDNMIRSYRGLSADISKLPHYVSTGSTCFFIDTKKMYMFEKTTDTWYET